MHIHRIFFWLAVLALAGCSMPEEADVGSDPSASVAQNEALVRQVLELIDARELDAAAHRGKNRVYRSDLG